MQVKLIFFVSFTPQAHIMQTGFLRHLWDNDDNVANKTVSTDNDQEMMGDVPEVPTQVAEWLM